MNCLNLFDLFIYIYFFQVWQTVHFEPRCLQNKQLLNNENTVPQQGTHKYVAAPFMCLNKYLIIIELMVTIGICCFYVLYYLTLPFFQSETTLI